MSYLNQRSKPALDRERSEVLQQLEDWLLECYPLRLEVL